MNTYEGICPVCKNTSEYHLQSTDPEHIAACNTCGKTITVTLKKGK
jgi:hypothetical protein